ncbi:MAG: dihydroflavonol 4-reductase, partial [Rhodothermaceae bacterium]|nr:dihydroflavonol 4-reductase [Rhodothermaceae bacterium]
ADALGVAPPRVTLPRGPAMILAVASEGIAALTRSRPLLTRETARTASAVYRYRNHKAIEELGCTFRPFAETAERIAQHLQMATS